MSGGLIIEFAGRENMYLEWMGKYRLLVEKKIGRAHV